MFESIAKITDLPTPLRNAASKVKEEINKESALPSTGKKLSKGSIPNLYWVKGTAMALSIQNVIFSTRRNSDGSVEGFMLVILKIVINLYSNPTGLGNLSGLVI
ncbi:MAG: hypothetical protein OHK0038_10970 [Flammeovirgaceae bacterium]